MSSQLSPVARTSGGAGGAVADEVDARHSSPQLLFTPQQCCNHFEEAANPANHLFPDCDSPTVRKLLTPGSYYLPVAQVLVCLALRFAPRLVRAPGRFSARAGSLRWLTTWSSSFGRRASRASCRPRSPRSRTCTTASLSRRRSCSSCGGAWRRGSTQRICSRRSSGCPALCTRQYGHPCSPPLHPHLCTLTLHPDSAPTPLHPLLPHLTARERGWRWPSFHCGAAALPNPIEPPPPLPAPIPMRTSPASSSLLQAELKRRRVQTERDLLLLSQGQSSEWRSQVPVNTRIGSR